MLDPESQVVKYAADHVKIFNRAAPQAAPVFGTGHFACDDGLGMSPDREYMNVWYALPDTDRLGDGAVFFSAVICPMDTFWRNAYRNPGRDLNTVIATNSHDRFTWPINHLQEAYVRLWTSTDVRDVQHVNTRVNPVEAVPVAARNNGREGVRIFLGPRIIGGYVDPSTDAEQVRWLVGGPRRAIRTWVAENSGNVMFSNERYSREWVDRAEFVAVEGLGRVGRMRRVPTRDEERRRRLIDAGPGAQAFDPQTFLRETAELRDDVQAAENDIRNAFRPEPIPVPDWAMAVDDDMDEPEW